MNPEHEDKKVSYMNRFVRELLNQVEKERLRKFEQAVNECIPEGLKEE